MCCGLVCSFNLEKYILDNYILGQPDSFIALLKRQLSYCSRQGCGKHVTVEEEPLCKAISSPTNDNDCEEAPGFVSHMLTFISLLLICVTFPLSLCWVVKVVQEYERAVVFRLGRMLTGKARGPGVFFIIPCIDVYEKIDLRTQTYDVPPQEVLTLTLTL